MKFILVAATLLIPVPPAFAATKACLCTCVVKAGDSYVVKSGKGDDREAAGESLKKALGKKKCELTPDCKGGGCKLD